MKRRLLVITLVLGMVSVIAAQQLSASSLQPSGASPAQREWEDDKEFAERDEIRQNYQLTTGARVEVSGINGSVDIETTSGNTAEVHIVRSARAKADLEYHKIIVEHSPSSLVVRGEKDNERNRMGRNKQVRHRVVLRLPRQIDLTASGVNGRVIVGAVDGPVRVSGINGKVEVAQAVGYSHISGINGRVLITIAGLSERGLHASGINGAVEMRFTEDLNADLDVSGVNGSVDTEMPNVTVQGKLERGNFRARIGSGGATISVSGVNGKVRLTRVGASG